MEYLDIIIVNDGSKDKTVKIARKYEFLYPQSIRVIDKENGGHGSGINISLAEAKGKYFKILDADDWFNSENLDIYIQKLLLSDQDIIISPYIIVDEEKKSSRIAGCDSLIGKAGVVEEYIEDISSIYQMHALTFRTEILRRSRRKITEKCFYVDQEYILYPLDNIKTFCYFDLPIYQYRMGRKDQSVNWNSMIKNRNMHMQVCNDLHKDYMEKKLLNGADELYAQRISEMLRIQLLIYMHMKTDIQTYKEYLQFLNIIKTYSKKERKRKIISFLLWFPLAYWGVSPIQSYKVVKNG